MSILASQIIRLAVHSKDTAEASFVPATINRWRITARPSISQLFELQRPRAAAGRAEAPVKLPERLRQPTSVAADPGTDTT